MVNVNEVEEDMYFDFNGNLVEMVEIIPAVKNPVGYKIRHDHNGTIQEKVIYPVNYVLQALDGVQMDSDWLKKSGTDDFLKKNNFVITETPQGIVITKGLERIEISFVHNFQSWWSENTGLPLEFKTIP